VSHCGGIRKPAHRHGATGTTRGSVDGGRGGTTSHHGRARSKRRSVDPPEPHRRRETAGCSIVRPTGGNSFRAGGKGGTGKIPFGRGATSSRTNEARVLEIEAADGRNRSYASRVRSRSRRKTGQANLALVRGLHGQTALMRPMAKFRANRCAKRRRVQLRIHGAPDRRRKQAVNRYGGRRPGSRLRHPFTGVSQERLWRVGLLR